MTLSSPGISTRSVPAAGTRSRLDLSPRWARRTAWIGLAAAILLVVIFSVVYRPLDFAVYRWGGQEVTHGLRLYQDRWVRGPNREWFTYPPFAAAVFVPLAAMPTVASQVSWQLLSLGGLAVAVVATLRMGGFDPSKTVIAAAVVIGMTLEPMYHTLFLGQVNLILFGLIMIDMWRAARGRTAGVWVGIAAAIKLTPLIFIPMFLVTRRVKDAVVATASFAGCAGIGYLVDPSASALYWHHLITETKRVGGGYISNQAPYGMIVRLAGGASHVGHWYLLSAFVLGTIALTVAAVLARHDDWLGAATVTGTGSLLVSPVSWTHHWVWILPALVILICGGRRARIGAACGYLLFVVAPMWFTPRYAGPSQYGFHGLVTLVANCYLVAALAFLGYMAWRTGRLVRAGPGSGGGGLAPAAAASADLRTELSPVSDR